MSEAISIIPVKKRSEYLAIAQSGLKKPMPGLVVQIKKANRNNDKEIRVGLTVTKRVGGAVERSRIKRRLREVIRDTMPTAAKQGYCYVAIGRRASLERPYELLADDLKKAVENLHKKI